MNKYIIGLFNNYDVRVKHPRHTVVLQRNIRAAKTSKLRLTYTDANRVFHIGYLYADNLEIVQNTIPIVFGTDSMCPNKTLHLGVTYMNKPFDIGQFKFDISIGLHLPLDEYWIP